MNRNFEPGYDLDACKEPTSRLCTHCGYDIEEDVLADLCRTCLNDAADLPLPCKFCSKPVTDDDFAESDQDDAHQACIEDNYEPPEPDYNAPSAAERLEMDHRNKEELR